MVLSMNKKMEFKTIFNKNDIKMKSSLIVNKNLNKNL
jgi:hypothetical protein